VNIQKPTFKPIAADLLLIIYKEVSGSMYFRRSINSFPYNNCVLNGINIKAMTDEIKNK
jgi:hypothetical protein